METMGSAIDKLITTNIKQYETQEKLHEAAQQGLPLDSENTGRIVTLNLQRNQLMTEIDQILHDAVSQGMAHVDPRIKIV